MHITFFILNAYIYNYVSRKTDRQWNNESKGKYYSPIHNNQMTTKDVLPFVHTYNPRNININYVVHPFNSKDNKRTTV